MLFRGMRIFPTITEDGKMLPSRPNPIRCFCIQFSFRSSEKLISFFDVSCLEEAASRHLFAQVALQPSKSNVQNRPLIQAQDRFTAVIGLRATSPPLLPPISYVTLLLHRHNTSLYSRWGRLEFSMIKPFLLYSACLK